MTTPVELIDEDISDPETVLISWVAPLYPHTTGARQAVANYRDGGDPLPFVLVNELNSGESVEESDVDALLSVHILTDQSLGQIALRDEAEKVHRRIKLLARELPLVPLGDDRFATIDYVRVVHRPHREDYGATSILRKVARYQMGLSYARI